VPYATGQIRKSRQEIRKREMIKKMAALLELKEARRRLVVRQLPL
jgi:hypothetical protein